MSLHERDCTYCGTLAQWRASDRPPPKCLSCGAPPERVKAPRMDFLYGMASLQAQTMGIGRQNDLQQRMCNPYGQDQNLMGNLLGAWQQSR